MPDSKIRALLIEDLETDAELLEELLEDIPPPVKLTWAQTFQAGIKELSQSHFDVVLLDLSLPDSEPHETISRLIGRCSSIPIVVLTGFADKEGVADALKLGAQDYLIKGQSDGETIHKAIRYAIERKRSYDLSKRISVLEEREKFIAMLTHDLRVPIIGNGRVLDLILEGKFGEVIPAQRQIIQKLCQSNRALLHMVTNVLDDYRLENGHETIVLRRVQLSALIEECIDEVLPLANGRDQRIYREINMNQLVMADYMAMRRVIINVLSNAIKFSPARSAIQIRLYAHGENALLEIQDSGRGIPPNQLEHLFEHLWQGRPKYRGNGLGLGLYLSRHLMNAQNGKIQCSKTGPDGTTFTVTLPLAKTKSTKVLVVDDTQVTRDVLRLFLKRLGVESESVPSGSEALYSMDSHEFCGVFLDLCMPGMDGFSTARAMREAGFEAPIVAYTALSENIDRRELKHAGIDDMLQKPIETVQLTKILNEWLN